MASSLSAIFGDFETKERQLINKDGGKLACRFCRDSIPILLPMITIQLLEHYPVFLTPLSIILASILGLIWVDGHLPAMIGRKQYEECCILYKPSLAFCFWTAMTNLIYCTLGISGYALTVLSGVGGTVYLNYLISS